MRNTKY